MREFQLQEIVVRLGGGDRDLVGASADLGDRSLIRQGDPRPAVLADHPGDPGKARHADSIRVQKIEDEIEEGILLHRPTRLVRGEPDFRGEFRLGRQGKAELRRVIGIPGDNLAFLHERANPRLRQVESDESDGIQFPDREFVVVFPEGDLYPDPR